MSTWLITGCSTGFGRQLALEVLSRGWQAAITARNLDDVADIAEKYPGTALPLSLDVTDPKAIRRAVSATVDRFGTVDVLVNNAGYGYRAAVEEGEDEEIRRLFETNVFGLAMLTREVLPHMREARNGTIVNLSSVAGRLGPPGSGYYAASKFAVEGISDALRHEVGPLGIHVMLVEPGPFRTDFAGRSIRQSNGPILAYAETAGIRRRENSRIDGSQAGDPARAARAIVEALQAETPPFRLVLGRDAAMRIRTMLKADLVELETWWNVALAADFPSIGG